jgi:hypothetical protein
MSTWDIEKGYINNSMAQFYNDVKDEQNLDFYIIKDQMQIQIS